MEGVVHIVATSIPETWSQKMPRIWKCGTAPQYISVNSQCKKECGDDKLAHAYERSNVLLVMCWAEFEQEHVLGKKWNWNDHKLSIYCYIIRLLKNFSTSWNTAETRNEIRIATPCSVDTIWIWEVGTEKIMSVLQKWKI